MFYLFDLAAYIPFGFMASLFYLVIHEIGLRVRNERVSWFHRIMLLVLGLYLTAVFALTGVPVNGFSISHFGNSVNLLPLQVLDTMADNPLNFWGNIILFIPFGAVLVFLSNRCQKIHIALFQGAGLSLLIEALQLFSIRGTDIDDIILNSAGTLCGYLIGRIILLAVPSLQKKVGVLAIRDSKYYRKRNDASSIAALTVFILISVIISGFSIKTADVQPLSASAINKPEVIVQPRNAIIPISQDINAKNAYLWNLSTNTVLYEKESDQQIAPASTAKMLTALTVLDYCDEDEEVLVGDEIGRIAKDSSKAWLYTGSRLTVRQLLDALLLPSGNDAAYALAAFTGRKICRNNTVSIEKALAQFIVAMNEKAADVGAVHSKFVNPDGYDADSQYTTAADLDWIAKAFMDSSILKGIAGSYRISDVWLNGREVTYFNTNELINPESPYYCEFATGLKTGKSGKAGCCLISSAYIDSEQYICVIMGSTEEGRWQDALKLYHTIRG